MRHIYGLHDPGGEYLFADRKGWIVFTEAVGVDPADKSGRDYRHWSDAGYGVLVRLNNGYGRAGTIPTPDRYDDFSRRVANFIAASKGCDTWIIGNEPSHSQERPNGQAITPPMYIDCFKRVHASVRLYAGDKHSLIPAPVAPWNVETGDWLEYQSTIWRALAGLSGGIALHTYSHGASPALITSTEKMDAPYQDRFYHFLAYRDFMQRIPTGMRGLPVYITETDPNEPWVDANTGWVQAAYAEIDDWNQTDGTQKIHCLCLYRWPKYDRWSIVDKPGVHADLRAAVAHGYQAPQIIATQVDRQKHEVYMPSIANGKVTPTASLPPRQWDERLTQRGVSIVEITPKAGESIWRVIKGHWLDEQASQGRHHIYVDVMDEQGNRLVGVPLLVTWPTGNTRITTEAKPGEPYAGNYPMSASGNEFSIAVVDGTPSEMVRGIGMGADTPGGFNAGIHTSTFIVFQHVTARPKPEPQPEPDQRVEELEEQLPMSGDKLTRQLATVLDIDPAVAQAVLAVESGNQAFVNGRMVIRFENHIFWQEWGKHHPDLFNQRFQFNRNEKTWAGHQWRPDGGLWRACHASQEGEWQVFEFARTLDETAAMRSMSMGAAQIMGFNHKRVNYPTVQELFHSYQASRTNQVMGFFFFVDSDPALVNALRQRDFVTFARGYNGTGQPEYYAGLIEARLEGS